MVKRVKPQMSQTASSPEAIEKCQHLLMGKGLSRESLRRCSFTLLGQRVSVSPMRPEVLTFGTRVL